MRGAEKEFAGITPAKGRDSQTAASGFAPPEKASVQSKNSRVVCLVRPRLGRSAHLLFLQGDPTLRHDSIIFRTPDWHVV